ncbi:MAG: tRNA (adenosine(37)-N6)-threonylcarbamoyltransferase complex ATPase subunit type 1 TsaE [Gemmatimonadaceae bacterium]
MPLDHPPIPPLAPRGRIALTRDELEAWGESFGRAARPPLLVTLSGDLGAGKTTLAQAICRGYGVRDAVTSPTYALVHEYASPRSPVFHVDLYRLAGEADLTNLAWDDVVGHPHALVLVEWPERAGRRLPAEHVPIDLEHVPGDPDRRLLLAG